MPIVMQAKGCICHSCAAFPQQIGQRLLKYQYMPSTLSQMDEISRGIPTFLL